MMPDCMSILNKCSERIEYTKLFQMTKKTSGTGKQAG
jgi:hypothetical protein